MSARARLTPQMAAYDAHFTDSGAIRWLPYVIYFQPSDYRSPVVNTDTSGFRFSAGADGRPLSVAEHGEVPGVRLLAGSSTVFGIGASSDAATLPSRMTAHDTRPEPWLNFGGRSYNSAQELVLMALHQHQLPRVEEIVLLSGFNNLGLSRMPAASRGEHGAFFNCNKYFEALAPASDPRSLRDWMRLRAAAAPLDDARPELGEQLDVAAGLTLRHFAAWKALADGLGARLTFVLQPLAGWVRPTGSVQEEALFAELDAAGSFTEVYGEILQPAVCHDYGDRLAAGADALGVGFVSLSPVMSERLAPDRWTFVDRIHFTDQGHDDVAQILLELTRPQTERPTP